MEELIETRFRNEIPEALGNALKRMFYTVVQVEPATDTVLILQSRDCSAHEGEKQNWSSHLAKYGEIMTEQGRAMLQEHFSSQALLTAIECGEREISQDLSYVKGGQTNWVTVSASLSQDTRGVWYAHIFVKQNNEEHLLRRIIDLYVYDTCDYFFCLDMKNNSFVMFSGRSSGTPLPPERGDDFDAAVVDYARSYVPPEDQEMCIEKMKLSHVRRMLEKKDTFSFTVGVMDTQRGYTRKRVTFRYYDRQAQKVLLSRTDVTEIYLEEQARLKELQAARMQAETDPLTGLLNYGGIKTRVEEMLAEEDGSSALLFIDLDNFKQVNDILGHQEGDKLLWKVAQILILQTEEPDLRGRVGGDEFVVFLPRLQTRKQAEACARHICEAVSSLSLPGGDAVTISCTIGCAIAPEDGEDYQALVAAADRRNYIAKRKGKNTYLFEG